MNDPSPATTPDSNENQWALSGTNPQTNDLQATQSLLRATLDASMDMIQVFQAVRNQHKEIVDFTWILNNHASEKIYGDVLGKNLLQLQPGVVEEGIFAAFKQVVETGQPQQYEKHYVHEQFDGWFFQSIVKLGDGVATTTADITDRKNAEQALQQSKALLQDVIDAPAIGIVVYKALRNDKGQIIDFVHEYINRASLAMLGGDDFTGKRFTDHGQNGILQLPQLIDVMETGIGNSYLREAQFRGRQVWFAITNSPLEGDRLVHTWEDITQRQQAEQERNEQAHFIQHVTQMMPDVVSVVEYPSRTIRYTNRDTLTWVGFDADALSRMSFEERIQLFHPDDLPAIQDFYGRFTSLKDGQETSVEYRLKNSQGDWILLSLRGQVFRRDEQGAATQLLLVGQNITAQRQAEKDILRLNDEVAQAATDKYRSLFDSIDEGFAIVEVVADQRGCVTDMSYREANKAFERHSGMRDFVGKKVSDILPHLEQHWLDLLTHVYQTGEPTQTEQHIAELGRWLHVNYSRVGGTGSPLVAVVFTDITERKQRDTARELLISIAQDLGQLTDETQLIGAVGAKLAAHLGITGYHYVDIDEDRDQVTVRHFWHALAVPPLLGTYPLRAFVTPAALADWRAGKPTIIHDIEREVPDGTPEAAVLKAGAAAQQISAFIAVGLSQEGQWKAYFAVADSRPRAWTAVEIELVQEAAGQLLPRIERARAEEALRQSQKRFESIANLVPDLLWDSEPDGATNWYNDRWLEYTGQTFQEAIGWGWTDAIHPEDRPASVKRYREAVAAGQPVRLEERIRRYDGAYRWFVVNASPLKDEQGRVVKMYGAATDIHESKRLEVTLREADRRKDEFLAMLAHELRNPMSTIRSGLQILGLTFTDELTPGATAASTVEMMNRQTDHLVRMVDDLLDVSRISRGKIDLHTERVNLVALMQQAVEGVQTQFEQQGKFLHLSLPSAAIELEGDATRLTQVVTNLLTNGARYTGERGSVWLSLKQQGQEAILQVRDNGIGLAADQLSAIFELFVQVDNSLARSKGGLGLGLTLVKRLVELHGGRVEAQSDGIGQGSTFRVHLPTLTAAEPVAKPAPQSTGPTVAGRILVVDDNADAAFTLAMLLKLKGYEAHTRTSGRAGLEAAEALQPAAILLDIGMPELDGYATCRAIREQPWGQAMVVIALTGYGQEEDRQRTKEAGFNGHLVKPVDLGALTSLLTDLLDKD